VGERGRKYAQMGPAPPGPSRRRPGASAWWGGRCGWSSGAVPSLGPGCSGPRAPSPPGWTVRVVAERGVSAPWRWRRLTRLGGQPFVRSNPGGSVRPTQAPGGRPWARCAPPPGTRGRGPGLACPRPPGSCPRRARGEDGAQAPGVLLTAGAPAAREAGGAGGRAWSAPGWQSPTRAGWPGHRPRRHAPDRAARRGWAGAGAPWWRRSGGGEADATMPPARGVP